jgi:hypothetical protein
MDAVDAPETGPVASASRSAEARRILKKYIANMATANTTRTNITNAWKGAMPHHRAPSA